MSNNSINYKGFNIASLLLGITAILIFGYSFHISILCSIIAIILGVISIKIDEDLNYKKGFGIASFILCLAFVVTFFYSYFSIPCLILAIVFGIASLKTSGYLINNKGFLIASLLCLIIFIVAFDHYYISASCFILTITLGIIGFKKDEKGMAISGIVLGAITPAIYLLSISYLIILFFLFGN